MDDELTPTDRERLLARTLTRGRALRRRLRVAVGGSVTALVVVVIVAVNAASGCTATRLHVVPPANTTDATSISASLVAATVSVAVGGSGVSGGAAVAGTFVTNSIDNTTRAVVDRATVGAGGAFSAIALS